MSVAEQTVTAPELAAVLGVTARRVRQLAEEGVIERPARGRYRLGPAVQAYCGLLSARGDGEEIKAERVALMRAQRRRIELANAATEGTADAIDWQDAMIAALSTHLFLRIRPVSSWLHARLQGPLGDEARVVAGELNGWIVGARAEVEQELTAAAAEARRRGTTIRTHDDLVRLIGRAPGDDEREEG